MFKYYYPDADAVLANPAGRVIIADGRNHLELTDKHYDIIVTDPPPPIESSGASVITSREYYQAGHDHLNPGGIMMEWVPYGQTIDEFKTHVRAFESVFPQVTIVFGPGGYGIYMLGSDEPIAFDHDAIADVLARPGVLDRHLERLRQPDQDGRGLDGRASTPLTWISGDAVTAFAGDGPMVTDDRPLSEYFLLRRLAGTAVAAGRARDAKGGGTTLVADSPVPARGVDRRRLLVRLGVVAGAVVFAVLPCAVGGPRPRRPGRHGRRRLHGLLHGLDDRRRRRRRRSCTTPRSRPRSSSRILDGRTFEAGLNPFNNPPHLVSAVRAAGRPAARDVISAVGRRPARPARVAHLAAADAGRADTWSRDERALLVAASLAAPPLALALLQGSFSLLVTVALLEVFLALRAGGERAAAAWLVVASVKPQAVLTTGVALLAARRWRVVGLAAVGRSSWSALRDGRDGRRDLAAYLRFLGDYVGSFDVFSVRPSVMWNLRGTLTLLTGPTTEPATAAAINTIALIGQLAALAAVAWLWRGRWDPATPRLRPALRPDPGPRPAPEPAPQPARRPAAGARRRDGVWRDP